MSVIGNPIMSGGGNGAYASIRVSGDIANTNTCYATLGSITKQGRWSTVPNPEYKVPSGYAQVEYLTTNNEAYIDTGYIPNVNTKLTGVGMYAVNSVMAGRRHGTDNTTYVGIAGSTTTSKYCGAFGCSATNSTIAMDTTTKRTFELYNNVFKVDGTQVSLASALASATETLYLFAFNVSGSPTGTGVVRTIYDFKIYENDVLVHHYIPAQRTSDSMYGMYDIVGNVFKEKQGTGAFTGGSVVPSTLSYWYIPNIKDYGTWTVHWSNGTKTTLRDVLIDVVTEYTVEDIERLFLYNEGDQCTSLTGGWKSVKSASNMANTVAPTFNIDYVKVYSSTNGYQSAMGTNNKIDLSNFSSIKIKVSGFSKTSSAGAYIYLCDSYPRTYAANTKFCYVNADGITEFDISSFDTEEYIAPTVGVWASSNNANMNVEQLWLE